MGGDWCKQTSRNRRTGILVTDKERINRLERLLVDLVLALHRKEIDEIICTGWDGNWGTLPLTKELIRIGKELNHE